MDIHSKNIGIKDGLPDNDIVYAMKDGVGRIWLQTLHSHPTYVAGDSVVVFAEEKSANCYLDQGSITYFCQSGNTWSMQGDTTMASYIMEADSFILKRYRNLFVLDTLIDMEHIDYDELSHKLKTAFRLL